MTLTKHQKLWAECRRLWISLNPPNFQGYWVCYICSKWIDKDELTLDHIISRSRAPALRYVLSNLAPCCGLCNTAKGSGEAKKSDLTSEPVAIDDIPW